MKHIPILLLLTFAASILPETTAAATDRPTSHMRPGLWEISTASPLLAMVPQIPTDQLDSLRRLARQHGIEVPELSKGAAVAQVCVTPDMARHDILPDLNQSQAGCSSRNGRRDGDHYSVDIVCQSDGVTGRGRAQGTLTSPETFVGSSEFSGTVHGMPVDQQAQTTGRWRGADCGNIRPLQ